MCLLLLSVVCVNHSDITHQHVRHLKIETMAFNFGACFPYCSIQSARKNEILRGCDHVLRRLDNERECSMGYSVPSKDRMPRGRRPRGMLSCEGRYIS